MGSVLSTSLENNDMYVWHPVSFISSFEERSIGDNDESDEATYG